MFFLNTTNVIKLFVTSEIIWVVLYNYSLIAGVMVDDLQMHTLALLLIALASVEFSMGFILIIFFKKIFKTTDVMDTIGSDWTVLRKFNKS